MSSLVRTCAAATTLLGLGLVVWSAFRAPLLPVPLVVTLALTGALLAVLGTGLGRGLRVAWSFTVAVLGVLCMAGLLAMPAIVRSGFPSLAAGVVLAVLFGLFSALVMGRDEITK